ncbi:MAG: KamA family radical SAM protein, partial [Desulfobacula sp.]|nr:KamA family radical SAM protein [Desulfobacula sp.]
KAKDISRIISLADDEYKAIEKAVQNNIPFGITPYYLALMDKESIHDRSLRAQVIPTGNYVEQMMMNRQSNSSCDFMLEADTSPIDLITRRYPAICIFKPFNTCPQICVYCQRNWEIKDVMSKSAMAGEKKILSAIRWIKDHPNIKEVLLTGGDPLSMGDKKLESILSLLSGIESIERIRIGTRTFATVPMRVTDNFLKIVDKILHSGKRVAFVTHIQHPYEITPQLVEAVHRLKNTGVSIYNQLVYTFFVSRRFEASALRRLIALIGIDPYYTFNTKGKLETMEYRVPIARLLQEQKEETRLLPGLSRTDEAVYNVPGQGKNYLRADIHRDLISIQPDGSRLYEFHPWERNVTTEPETYIDRDIPILTYLQRLEQIGENVDEYNTIWYFY